MGIFNWKESSNTQQSESEKKEDLTQSTVDTQQLPEEQIDCIIQQLHEEKHKNTELRQTIEQLQAIIEEKDKRLKAQCEQEVSEQQVISEDESNKTEETQQPAEVQPTFDNNQEVILNQMKAVSESLDLRMKELINDRKMISEKLEEKNSRLEELLSRLQEDRYRKDKVKILRRNINLRNLVSSVLSDYRDELPRMDGYNTPAAIFLEQQLERIIERIDADLKQEMLIPLVKGIEGSDFDAEHQEIVERHPTDNPELDGKVYKSVAPGYIWTLPYIFKPRINETGEEIYTYQFLLRSEDVITYKYERKEQ